MSKPIAASALSFPLAAVSATAKRRFWRGEGRGRAMTGLSDWGGCSLTVALWGKVAENIQKEAAEEQTAGSPPSVECRIG